MAKQGADRRAFARLPLQLDAVIAVGSRPPFTCTIRDFCPAGMFVALPSATARSLSPNEPAIVHVALIVGGNQREFQVRVVIARVVANGVGTAFVDADPQLIKLLNDFVGAVAARAGVRRQRDFAPEYAGIVEPLLEITRRHVRDLVESFYTEADQMMFLGARDAKSNTDQALYFDTQGRLRAQRERLRREIPERVEEGVRNLKNPFEDTATEQHPEAALQPKKLSLVDKDAFEDFLSLSEIVSNIEPQIREPLYDLEQRLSYLANRTLDSSINPLGPAVICHAFTLALRDVAVERRGLNVLYKALAAMAPPVLGRLLADVNRLLIDRGILPVIERDKGRTKRPPAPPRPTGAATPDRTAPADLTSTWSGAGAAGSWPAAGEAPPGSASGARQPGGAAAPVGGAMAGPWSQGMLGSTGGAESIAQSAAAALAGQAGSGIAAGVPAIAHTLAANASYWPQAISAGVPPHQAPSFTRAYGAARNLMHMHRDLASPDVAVPASPAECYSPVELIDGLSSLQHRLANESDPRLFDATDIRAGVEGALRDLGISGRQLDPQQSDAIEIISNLFRSLVEDVMITEGAKKQIKRLQPSLHKVALLDSEFFQSSDHPARRVLNRVAGLRGGTAPDGRPYGDLVAPLIDRLNREFDRDIGVFRTVDGDLDRVLGDQREAYQANLHEVTRACDEQQEMLRRHRGSAELMGSATADNLPAEWQRWLERCRSITIGTGVLMNANRPNPQHLTVAWIGEGHDPLVFVNDSGQKVQTLTLQQTAMHLRRGVLRIAGDEDTPAVERALYGVLQRMHGQVEQQATIDRITGFLTRKNFLAQIERSLPELADAKRGAILAQLRLVGLDGVNREHGTDAGDALLAGAAAVIRELTGKYDAIYGRVEGPDLGICFRRAALPGVRKALDELLDAFDRRGVEWDGQRLELTARCGVTEYQDTKETAEQLLSAAAAACVEASRGSEQRICVSGETESRQRERLDQMVAYIPKAIERQRLRLLYHPVRPVVGGAADSRPAIHLAISAVDRTHKLIAPELFQQAAANSAQALAINRWGIGAALRWMSVNPEDLQRYDSLIIPLSAAVLRDDLATGFIVEELMRTEVPPGRVCFAMNDAEVLAHLSGAIELARTLHDFGCRFLLDEFGSGQGSYDYVRDLQIDYVAIQTLFVRDAAHDPKDLAMVKSINELAHFMGKRTIARQTTDETAVGLLRDIGVDFIQELGEPAELPSN